MSNVRRQRLPNLRQAPLPRRTRSPRHSQMGKWSSVRATPGAGDRRRRTPGSPRFPPAAFSLRSISLCVAGRGAEAATSPAPGRGVRTDRSIRRRSASSSTGTRSSTALQWPPRPRGTSLPARHLRPNSKRPRIAPGPSHFWQVATLTRRSIRRPGSAPSSPGTAPRPVPGRGRSGPRSRGRRFPYSRARHVPTTAAPRAPGPCCGTFP